MKLEHCFKCKKQIEFRKSQNPQSIDEQKSEMNHLEAQASSQTSADVFEFWFCDSCWFKMGGMLQKHGYLPYGMDGFSMEEK